jgi:hypothetical protein
VETHVVPSGNPPSGVGEPGTPVIAPAVANALLVLSNAPTTRLPFVRVPRSLMSPESDNIGAYAPRDFDAVLTRTRP